MTLGLTLEGTRCDACGTAVAPSLLACPSCHALVHAARLKDLSAAAHTASCETRVDEEIAAWEQALPLLPAASRQHHAINERLAALYRSRAEAPSSGVAGSRPQLESRHRGRWAGAAILTGGLLWKFKFIVAFVLTKGKLLLLGLSKGTTVFSMLASVGVYWAAFGLPFAAGLIGSIYVHEMGHVAALRRYGLPATAPMFIPGLGAFIRVRHMPASLAEQARVGLAGPVWGLGAALAALAAYVMTGNHLWAAIAHVGAWLNLFNLTPIWQLDGSRGFVALSRAQRWLLCAVIAGAWLATGEGLLVLVVLVAVGRTLLEAAPESGDRGALAQFAALIVALGAIDALTPALSF